MLMTDLAVRGIERELGGSETGEVPDRATVPRSLVPASRITDSERAERREEPTVLPYRTEHRSGERAELGLEAVGRVGHLDANRPVERLCLPLIEGGEEVVLVVEVLVDERSSDLGTRRNRPHRDRPGPTLGEEVAGDIE